jgi:hypothetical protein
MRQFFCFFAVFPLVFSLHAQEPAAKTEIFPVSLIFEAAGLKLYSGEAFNTFWRPEWPLELPPDAFRLRSGEISRCTIRTEGFTLDFRLDSGGRLEAFPLMLNGRMAQVRLGYDEFSKLREIDLSFPSGEEPWKMEVLESKDAFPSIVRAFSLDSWYFIYLSSGVNEILETWYDEEGNALGAFGFSFTEVGRDRKLYELRDYLKPGGSTGYHYDSRGFVTDISGPSGFFKVLYYREDLPRYWERRPVAEENIILSPEGNFYLEWDEEDFLLRIRGDEPFVDYRYEYSLDEKGNWIERRETRMIRSFGLLVPAPGTTFTRVLEYKY